MIRQQSKAPDSIPITYPLRKTLLCKYTAYTKYIFFKAKGTY